MISRRRDLLLLQGTVRILLLYTLTVAAAMTINAASATHTTKIESKQGIKFRSVLTNRHPPSAASSSPFIYEDSFRYCYNENFGSYVCESNQLIPGAGTCQSLHGSYGAGRSAYFYCGNVTSDPSTYSTPSWKVQYFATSSDCSGPAVINTNGIITLPDYQTWSNMTNTASESSDLLQFEAWITCNIYSNTTNPMKPPTPFRTADGIGIWVEITSAVMLLVLAGLGVCIFNKRKAAAAMPVAPFSPLGIPMVDL